MDRREFFKLSALAGVVATMPKLPIEEKKIGTVKGSKIIPAEVDNHVISIRPPSEFTIDINHDHLKLENGGWYTEYLIEQSQWTVTFNTDIKEIANQIHSANPFEIKMYTGRGEEHFRGLAIITGYIQTDANMWECTALGVGDIRNLTTQGLSS